MEIKQIFELFGLVNNPGLLATLVSLLAVLLGFWMKKRQVNIEEKTTASSIDKTRIESLIAHIEMLSSELHDTRSQLLELHNQNIVLMGQLREANKRIGELEELMNHQRTKSAQEDSGNES